MFKLMVKFRQLQTSIDRLVDQIIRNCQPALCATTVSSNQHHATPSTSSNLNELLNDGFVFYCPVPKKRTSHERKLVKKFLPYPNNRLVKWAMPKTNIITCLDCGNFHEKGTICGKCYESVKKSMKAAAKSTATNKQIEA